MASEPKIVIKGSVELNGQVLAPAALAANSAVSGLKCSYCRSRFVPLATSNCPNCGAAHSG